VLQQAGRHAEVSSSGVIVRLITVQKQHGGSVTSSAGIGSYSGIPLRLSSVQDADRDRAIVRFATIQFLALIYLQKFALFATSFPLNIPMVVMLVSVAYMVVFRHVTIVQSRLAIFLIFLGFCLFSEALVFGSISSFGQLVLMYSATTLRANLSASGYRQILDRFVKLMILPAAIIPVQYFYQKLTGLSDPFNLEAFFPQSVLMPGFFYNARYPWFSTFSRPNGFFFLGPSFASAFTACAAIIEICYFRSAWRIALMVAATVFSMGSTGMLMLLIAVPFLLRREPPTVIFIVAIGIMVYLVIALMADLPLPMVARVDEFNDPLSSGSDRLLLSSRELLEWILNPSSFVIGSGAGSSPPGQVWPLLKLLREYGLLAMLSFLVLYIWGNASNANVAVRIPLSIIYLFTGGYLLSPVMVVLVILFCFVLDTDDQPAASTVG